MPNPFGIGGFKKGNKLWLGMHHSQETKNKLSELRKGSKLTPEQKAKLSMALRGNQNTLGYRHTEGTKKKMSAAHKGKRPFLNRRHTKEAREKISAGLRGNKNTLGHKATTETRIKLSKSHIKIKDKLSKIAKELWSNPIYIEKTIKALERRPTLPERIFNEMTPRSIRYVGNRAWWQKLNDGHRHNPDFKVTGQNKVIEIFGDYYHRPGTKKDDPQKLISLYAQAGFDCLIVWEKEIYRRPEQVLERVNNFLIRQ